MKISDYIAALEKIKEEHGDLRCTTHAVAGLNVINANPPSVENIREKRNKLLLL